MVARGPADDSTQGENVRERVLREATRLFAARGFDGTPLQAIADAVGVTKPAVLHHFPSKEELHQAVLDQLLSRWNDVLPRLLIAATAGEHRFDGITQEVVTFFQADPDRARLLVREVLDRPAAMRERVRAHVRPWVSAIAEYIRAGQRTGEIRADVDPDAYVVDVVLLVLSAVASVDSVSAMVPGPAEDAAGRCMTEMLRIARASLFTVPVPYALAMSAAMSGQEPGVRRRRKKR